MLTIDDLREHVTSTLGDDALELHLNAAYEVIDDAIGSNSDVSELIYAGSGPLFMLSRRAKAIVSISERDVALDPLDYELRGRLLIRLDTGPHSDSRWRGWVDVTYTPEASEDLRDEAAIALVKLRLNYDPGVTSERIGDWTSTQSDGAAFIEERQTILDALAARTRLVIL
jgi:hypothetical protein